MWIKEKQSDKKKAEELPDKDFKHIEGKISSDYVKLKTDTSSKTANTGRVKSQDTCREVLQNNNSLKHKRFVLHRKDQKNFISTDKLF